MRITLPASQIVVRLGNYISIYTGKNLEGYCIRIMISYKDESQP